MDYQYLGYTGDKQIVKGTISTSNKVTASQILAHRGYRVVSLEQESTFIPNWEQLFPSFFRVKPAAIIMFSRQLALLLESGIDIVTALGLLQAQASSGTLRRVLGEIVSDLRSGSRLSAALDKHPKVFPPIYRRSLSVGEQTGSLENVLKQIAEYMEREVATSKGVQNALRYPAIVTGVAVIVMGVLAFFILPAFTDLYSTLGTELPLMTRMLVTAVDILTGYGLLMLIIVVTVVVGFFVYIKTPAGMYRWHRQLLRLPLVGRVTHLTELARCCRSMSLLFCAGLPLPEIMSMIIQGSGNKVMAEALGVVKQDMMKGEGLSRPMRKSELFLPMMVQMVKVGEETGSLDTTLLSVAQSYETEAGERTQALIGLIQPAMTIAIGLVVAVLALSMVSTMYNVYDNFL
ncbi:type II secretion system F family protein [Chloroflexota bacterium]